ncbi:MAG: hypothetical protein HYX84_02485 [Chloroflexi bacterium]|nr:hypothetical protein [Chloroflexota bacterium]
MGKATVNMTPEQEEILDSGLRMLAHMIAETHLRRTALRKQNESTNCLPEVTDLTRQKIRGRSFGENISEDNDE